ncbi:hypothetical protein UA08_04019 [Talaromyces atroroseus]|uniref:PRISE-like Rossmann-fold domain-containing protein n=1 Tax=Talaromyces atroroseus TaxID=1441469 RepID=A0A1Q5Q8M6_TALAT|nr:hypothetical protein UA08_04019 [Talaromyces atroroseus]OKL60379.1 hypothetical protein UA08_04019 [Talaromyces atroroseus]
MAESSNHAIVYGASGLIGWAIANQLLHSYPHAGAFSKVTAVTNRSLNLSEAFWPELDSQRPDLRLVSGIDIGHDNETTVANALKLAVKDIETVTHVFYLVFAANDDDLEEVAINRRMFLNVIRAHDVLSPSLQFVAFAGGTRGYGIYAPGGTFTPPLREEMVNNLPPDYAKTVVYPEYRRILNVESEGKPWTWCEVCPDAIIGFTPNGSQFSLALHWAQYLSLYAYNHGIGPSAQKFNSTPVGIPFPGNVSSANSLFSPVSSQRIARFMIYASLHPGTCGGGRLFNIADSEVPCKYGELWPQLAAWFGLLGTGEAETSTAQDNTLKVGERPQASATSLTPGEYIAEHRSVFARHGRVNAVSKGVGFGSRQLDSVGYWLSFDRQMSLDRLKETKFESDQDPVQGWLESFEMFRKAGLIL